MITPASTLHDLIEGRSLGSPPIRNILEELPIPSRDVAGFFTKPMSLSPTLGAPASTTTNQGSKAIVADSAEDTNPVEDAALELAALLRNRRNSNLELRLGSAPTELPAVKTIQKHLKALKPSLETLPTLAEQSVGEPVEKYRARILDAIAALLHESEGTSHVDVLVAPPEVLRLTRAWLLAGMNADNIDTKWLKSEVAPGQIDAIYTREGNLKYKSDISSSNRVLPRSTRLVFVATPTNLTKGI